ncbi:MAG: hypothetical protein IJU81_02580 [Bacteroidales bacterium]|nr:hypothetical protein [Bacteroidales bacterium]
MAFVKTVVDNFNTIYQGSNGSLVLCVYDVPLSMVAAVTLEYEKEKHYWLVRTAEPVKASQIRNHPEKILWTKEPALK